MRSHVNSIRVLAQSLMMSIALGGVLVAQTGAGTTTTTPQVPQPIQPGEVAIPAVPIDVRRWPNLDIPEFHDAQRFDLDGMYGAFVRAFAAPVDGATYTFDRWLPVGVVLVDTWTKVVDRTYTVGGARVNGPMTVGNVPALPAWDVYTNLGLKAGWNCVYMRRGTTGRARGGATTGGVTFAWRAIIGQPNTSKGCTLVNSGVDPAGKELQVSAIAAANPSDVIAVARILDMPGGRRAFGFRCEDRWCVIGDPVTAIPAPAHAGARGAGANAQWTLQAWFDEQSLAVPMSPPTGRGGAYVSGQGLRPRQLATVVPAPNLSRLKTDREFREDYVQVATVFLAKPAEGKYKTRWQFKQGMNPIYLRVSGTSNWEAFVDGEKGKVPLKVTRHDHKDFFARYRFFPATARWAFVDYDEAVWISCDLGCCYIEPF